MPVAQVIAIYTERNYQVFADEWEASWYMSFWETIGYEKKLAEHIAEARVGSGGEDREIIPMVSLLLPAMQAARQAQVRLEREIASLRVIEALRMYAAENNGKLPQSLDDIWQVPVPINPATGKEFLYHVDGETAILERDDAGLVEVSRTDLREATGLSAVPVETRVTRWDDGLPQYPVGHHARVARLREHLGKLPGLAVCGAAYDGVGVPACVASAAAAVDQIHGDLRAVRHLTAHPVQSLHGGAGE